MWWTWNSSGCRPRQEKILVVLSSDVFWCTFVQNHHLHCVNLGQCPVGSSDSIPSQGGHMGPQNHPGGIPATKDSLYFILRGLGLPLTGESGQPGTWGGGWHTWHFETTFQNKQEMIDFNIDWSYSFNRFRFYHNLSGFHASFRMSWRLRFDLWFGLQADWEEGPVCDFHHREPSKWSCIFSSNHFEPIFFHVLDVFFSVSKQISEPLIILQLLRLQSWVERSPSFRHCLAQGLRWFENIRQHHPFL